MITLANFDPSTPSAPKKHDPDTPEGKATRTNPHESFAQTNSPVTRANPTHGLRRHPRAARIACEHERTRAATHVVHRLHERIAPQPRLRDLKSAFRD